MIKRPYGQRTVVPDEYHDLLPISWSFWQLHSSYWVDIELMGLPSPKAACAAISKVPRLVSYPNSLAERWSISLRASALSRSKASRVLLGREDLAPRASRPLWLNLWMASRTVCWPQPRLWAILGACSPLELASKIWQRRKVKASLERSPLWRASRSSSENEPTEIGISVDLTVTRNTKPILMMH
jgi:hypothetical protein